MKNARNILLTAGYLRDWRPNTDNPETGEWQLATRDLPSPKSPLSTTSN